MRAGGGSHKERIEVLVACLRDGLSQSARANVSGDVSVAMDFLGDAQAVAIALPLAGHPDTAIRFGVVHVMSGQMEGDAIRALIDLSTDEDKDVRDWAMFALGQQIDTDTPVQRDALARGCDDADPDVRAEAIAGLARRGDRRAMAPLIAALDRGELAPPLPDAAVDLESGELCRALQAIQRLGLVWDRPL